MKKALLIAVLAINAVFAGGVHKAFCVTVLKGERYDDILPAPSVASDGTFTGQDRWGYNKWSGYKENGVYYITSYNNEEYEYTNGLVTKHKDGSTIYNYSYDGNTMTKTRNGSWGTETTTRIFPHEIKSVSDMVGTYTQVYQSSHNNGTTTTYKSIKSRYDEYSYDGNHTDYVDLVSRNGGATQISRIEGTNYTYDESGKIVSSEKYIGGEEDYIGSTYNYVDGKLKSKTEITHVMDWNTYEVTETTETTETYEYDDDGNLKVYNKDGQLVGTYQNLEAYLLKSYAQYNVMDMFDSDFGKAGYVPSRLQEKHADGSITLYNEDGTIRGYKNKRIYTVDEANRVAGKTNRFSIKYR